MLVVIGIIAVIIAASFTGYNAFVRKASRSRAQELVSNVQTVLANILQSHDYWPRVILNAGPEGGQGRLTENVGRVLARNGMSLAYRKTKDEETGQEFYELIGNDRFGIVSPWALDYLRRNKSATLGATVPSGGTIQDHLLYFAVDADYDGYVSANVGGVNVTVRGSVMVWCAGANGIVEPYPYKRGGGGGGSGGQGAIGGGDGGAGGKSDDVYSWSPSQQK